MHLQTHCYLLSCEAAQPRRLRPQQITQGLGAETLRTCVFRLTCSVLIWAKTARMPVRGGSLFTSAPFRCMHGTRSWWFIPRCRCWGLSLLLLFPCVFLSDRCCWMRRETPWRGPAGWSAAPTASAILLITLWRR